MKDMFTQEPHWVDIAFSERFKDPMLLEPLPMKIQTARYSKMAETGDCFRAFGATFTVLAVYKRPLWRVVVHYVVEGFESQDDFREFWATLHPKRGFRADDDVWVHTFRRNGGGNNEGDSST